MNLITAAQLRDRIDSDEQFTLVDTRLDESFEAWRIEGAVQYPYKPHYEFDLETFVDSIGCGSEDPIVTICAKGKASRSLAEELEAAGYEDVTVVTDGMEGWSAVYDRARFALGDLDVVQVQRRAKGCLGYVVAHGQRAAVFDPTRHTDEFVGAAEALGASIEAVFDTHVHADHVSGGRRLADELGVPYYLGADATDRGVEYAYEPLDRNETVEVGATTVKALSTPGHTSEMVSYLLDDRAVVTGDTLFVDSVGRTELQFGDCDAESGAELLYESLHRTLLAQPETVTVLPGHFSIANDGTTPATPGEPIVATVGDVRTGIDLLSTSREEFVRAITASLPEKPPNYETVIDVNRGVESIEEESRAIELELGPNRCAAAPDPA